ncbi:AAA family ATPase [Sulfolobus tengchongensis]|uniref:AAA family ATPase n=1 Tax=Sulfolobus tengchongensis TaxID=207809 RepID=A0AAX4KWS1_9CREN
MEAFLLLREIVRPSGYPPLPFLNWSGYDKVVFMNDTSLDIYYEIEGTYDGKDFYYSLTINGYNGLLIKSEYLNLGNLKIERNLNKLTIEKNSFDIPQNLSMFSLVQSYGPITFSNLPLTQPDVSLMGFLSKFINDIIVLRIIPENAISPVPFNMPMMLRIDGYGLPKILQNLPMHEAVSMFLERFNLTLTPIITDDGKIKLNVKEKVDGNEIFYPANSLPSGLVKMLTIMVTVYMLKHSPIVIDEVENSLHVELLGRLIDLIRESEPQFIITTHSPAIVDLINPEDVILLERDKGETKASRLQNVKELKKKLEELGLTLSEWIF